MLRASVVVAALAAAGCHSYQPLTEPATAATQMAKVQFSQPRDLTGHLAGGADSTLKKVSSIEGHVLLASVDTLQLTVSKFNDAFGEHSIATSFVVTVVSDPSVAVDVLALDRNRTAAVAGGSLYVVGAVALVALTAAIIGSSGGGW
jgi:hypothetical protein